MHAAHTAGPLHSEKLLLNVNYPQNSSFPQLFKGSGTCLMTSQMKLWVGAYRFLELFLISYRSSFHFLTFPNKSCLVLQTSKCVICFACHGGTIISNVLMTMLPVFIIDQLVISPYKLSHVGCEKSYLLLNSQVSYLSDREVGTIAWYSISLLECLILC